MVFDNTKIKYVAEFILARQNSKLVSLTMVDLLIAAVYDHFIDFYDTINFHNTQTFGLNPPILNNKLSEFIKINKRTFFLTLNEKNDTVYMFDVDQRQLLAEFHQGNKIEQIYYLPNKQHIVIMSFLKLTIYQVFLKDNTEFESKIYWEQRIQETYIIERIKLNCYYNDNDEAMLIIETNYLILVINVDQKLYQSLQLSSPILDSKFIRQRKMLVLFFPSTITIYDTQSIYDKNLKKTSKSITGNNVILSYNENYIYITSTENSYSEIYFYDFQLNLINNQKIVNIYGRPIAFFRLDYCHQLDANLCDPSLINKQRLVLSVENNMIFIEDTKIISVAFPNCLSVSNTYLQEDSKQVADYVKDNIRGQEFIVSLNLYSRLTFIIVKVGISRYSVEISDPYLQNLQIDNIANVNTFLDENQRLLKVIGVIKIEDGIKKRLAITFSYNDFKVINIEKYQSIENVEKELFIAQKTDSPNKQLFQNVITRNPSQTYLTYTFPQLLTSNFKQLLRNEKYIVYSDDRSSTKSVIWVIQIIDLTLVYNLNISNQTYIVGFLSQTQLYLVQPLSIIQINILNKSTKIFSNKFNFTPVKAFIKMSHRVIAIDYMQSIGIGFITQRVIKILKLDTFELVASLKPLTSEDDSTEDGEWKTYIGNNVQFIWIDPLVSNDDFLFLGVTTWKNLQDQVVNSSHLTRIHFVATFGVSISSQIALLLKKEIYQFSRFLYSSYDIQNDFSLNQFTYINLIDSKQQANMLCQKDCNLNQLKVRSKYTIYQTLIFPNIANMLKLEFWHHSDYFEQKVFLKIMLLDQRQLILNIYYFLDINAPQNQDIIIELISYPLFQQYKNVTITKPCEYNLFQIIKDRGIIITCSQDQIKILDIFSLQERIDLYPFSHFQNCSNDTNNKDKILIKSVFFSQKFPLVYFNQCGVFDYSLNQFTYIPEILIQDFALSSWNSTFKYYIKSEKPKHFYENQSYLYISNNLEIMVVQKNQGYKVIRKRNPSTTQSSRPQFLKSFILFKITFNQSLMIILQDYEFNSLQQFAQNDSTVQFISKDYFYFDCPEQSIFYTLYTQRIEGYYYPFKPGQQLPQFQFLVSNYTVCACTDKYLIIQIVNDKNSVDAPGEKVLYLQFIDVQNQKVYKELVLYKQNYKIDYDKLDVNPIFIKEKAIIVLSNLLISLQSDFFQVLPEPLLLYDKYFDFAILSDTQRKKYFQIMDFSTIFPFKSEFYEITSTLVVSGFVIPALEVARNPSHRVITPNYIFIHDSYWDVSKRSFIVYYQNDKKTIYFYDYKDNKMIELKVDIPDSPYLQKYIMNIDLFEDSSQLDRLIFRGIILDRMIFFNIYKIISTFSLSEYNELYLNQFVAEKNNKLYFLNFTQQFNQTSKSIEQINLESQPLLPQNISDSMSTISHVRLFGKNQFVTVLDVQNHLIIHDIQKGITFKSTLDFSFNQVNEFHFKNYYKTFILFISYGDSIRMYDPFLQEVASISGFIGAVRYAYIDPDFQQIYFSDYYYIYSFKYDQVIFEQGKQQTITSSSYFIDKVPLQTRGNYIMKKISKSYFAIVAQSNCYIYKVENSRIALQNRVVSSDFKNVRDIYQIDDQFFLVSDQSGVYLYQRTIELDLKLIFTKQTDFLKILQVKTFMNNYKYVLQLLGVSSNNVFYLEQELFDTSQNVPSRFKLDYIPPTQFHLQNVLSEKQIHQCRGRYQLQDDINIQNMYLESILENVKGQQITELTFRLVKENTVISLPRILHNLELLNNQNKLKIIYDLQNYTAFIQVSTNYKVESPIISSIEFKNGFLFSYPPNFQIQNLDFIQFQDFDSIQITNVEISQELHFKRCGSVILDQLSFSEGNYFQIQYSNEDYDGQGQFKVRNMYVQAQSFDQSFLNLESLDIVQIQNITIAYQNMNPSSSSDTFQLIYLDKINKALINQLNMEGINYTKNIIKVGFVRDLSIQDSSFNNITLSGRIEESYSNKINQNLRMMDTQAFIDIQFIVNQLNLFNITVSNSQFTQFINLRNYIKQESFVVSSPFDNIGSLEDNSIEPTLKFQRDSLQQIKFLIDSYEQFQVTIDHATFKNISNIKISTVPDNQNLLNIYGGNFTLSNSIIESISNFHSCLNIQNGYLINIYQVDITNVNSNQFVVKVSQAENVLISFTNFKNNYDLNSIIKISNANTSISNSMIYQVSQKQNRQLDNLNSQIYKLQSSAIDVSFSHQNQQGNFLMYQTIVQNIISLSTGGAIKINNAKKANIQLCVIKDNLSFDNGGGIFAVSTELILQNTVISGNQAKNSGGGIYIEQSEFVILDLEDQNYQLTLVTNNIAKIGGGIRYMSVIKPLAIKNNSHKFIHNYANYFGNDYTFMPQTIVFPEISDNRLLNVTSSQTKSSSQIKLYWVDEQGKRVNLKYQDEYSFLNFNKIESEIENYRKFKIISNQILFNGGQKQLLLEGVLDDDFTTIILNLSLLYHPKKQSELIIYPIYNHLSSEIKLDLEMYKKQLQVGFRNCVQGEILKPGISNYIECVKCVNNTFSLEIPSYDSKNVCQPCPDSFGCEGNIIFLKDGFWKEEGTSFIQRCYNQLDKCKFSSQKGKMCIKGSLGPRCESCDYSNINQEGVYGKNGQFDCQLCDQSFFKLKQLIMLIGLIAVFGAYQGILVLQLNHTLSRVIKGIYLKKLGIMNFSNTLNKNGFSTLMKFFISYLQLLQILSQFKFNFPDLLNQSLLFFGNPLASSQYSLDCFLVKTQTHKKIEIVYLRLIWSIFMTVAYFLITAITLLIYAIIENRKYKLKVVLSSLKNYLRSACFYLYYLVFPSFVISFANIIGCQKIGSNSYILADNQFNCKSQNHILIGYKICLPFLILFALGIPMLILYKLYTKQRNLRLPSVFIKYGFFFLEYRDDRYYWEVIKMIKKSLIYIVCSVLNDNQLLKGSLLSFFMIIYMRLTYSFKPYKKITLNELDFYNTFILLISFQLGIINISTDDPYIQIASLALMLCFNLLVLVYFIRLILKQQIQIMPTSHFYSYAQCLKKAFPSIFGKIIVEPKNCFLFHRGWEKVRQVMKYYQPYSNPLDLNKFEQYRKIKPQYESFKLIKTQTSQRSKNSIEIDPIKFFSSTFLKKSQFSKINLLSNHSISQKRQSENEQDDSSDLNYIEVDENKIKSRIDKFDFDLSKVQKLNQMSILQKMELQQDSHYFFNSGSLYQINDEKQIELSEFPIKFSKERSLFQQK